MQDLSTTWIIFSLILFVSLLVTFLFDYLGIRYLIKGTAQTPSTTIDEKPNREIAWGCGIIPGLLTFTFLSLPILLDWVDATERFVAVLTFAILDIIASYSGGRFASFSTKQREEVDFKFESEV